MQYNLLDGHLPETSGTVATILRSAVIGFSSATSSAVASNWARVIKTNKQTHPDPNISYVMVRSLRLGIQFYCACAQRSHSSALACTAALAICPRDPEQCSANWFLLLSERRPSAQNACGQAKYSIRSPTLCRCMWLHTCVRRYGDVARFIGTITAPHSGTERMSVVQSGLTSSSIAASTHGVWHRCSPCSRLHGHPCSAPIATHTSTPLRHFIQHHPSQSHVAHLRQWCSIIGNCCIIRTRTRSASCMMRTARMS